jgi:elongation factor G
MSGKTATIRNLALIGHSGCGKTSLAEALLFSTGATNRLGKVDDGTSVLDFEPEEIKRKITISSAFHHYTYKKHTVYLADTPGDDNFLADTRAVLHVVDAAVVVIDAVDGVKVGTEKVWQTANDMPAPPGVHQQNGPGAGQLRPGAGRPETDPGGPGGSPAIAHRSGSRFQGVVDLVALKAYTGGAGGKMESGPVPEDLKDEVEQWRGDLLNFAAESDDALIEKFLEEGDLSPEEIYQGLRLGTIKGQFVPVLFGATHNNLGYELLLEAINQYLPAPEDRGQVKGINPATKEEALLDPDPDGPLAAQVFKTVADPYAGRLSIFRVFSGTMKSDATVFNVTRSVPERYGQLFLPEGKGQKPVAEAGPGAIAAVAKLKETVTGDTLGSEAKPVLLPPLGAARAMITLAVEPKSKGDEDKVYSSIQRLLEEDNSLKLTRNAETKEILLSGVGSVHIEATVEKLKRKFGVEVNLKQPKVPYRETIKGSTKVQGKYKRQSGGRGQYGTPGWTFNPCPGARASSLWTALWAGPSPKTISPRWKRASWRP